MSRINEPVPVSCLDKPRSLKLTAKSIDKIKKSTGTNLVMWSGDEWMKILDPCTLASMVAACLMHEDDAPSEAALLELMETFAQMQELGDALQRAYSHFHGRTDQEHDLIIAAARKKAEAAARGEEAEPPVPLVATD